jgi:acyl-coenzyme A synthetase/AMP-(fatty) acid ligase
MSEIFRAVRALVEDSRLQADAAAIVANGHTCSYRQLLQLAEQEALRVSATDAHAKRRRLGKGWETTRLSDPVAFAVSVLGCDLAGVPVAHEEPSGHSTLPASDAALPPSSQIFLTSGTTGPAAGVVRSARAVVEDARRVAAFLGYRPGHPVVVAAPLFHVYGLNYGLVAPLVTGASIRCVPPLSVPSQLAAAVASHRAETLVALPAHYGLLSKAACTADVGLFGGLRSAVSAGGPVPSRAASVIAERLPFDLFNCYGSSEAGAVTLTRLSGREPDGWIGAPLPGVSARVGNDDRANKTDELHLRTASLATGLLGPGGLGMLPRTGDGWYRTGDLAVAQRGGLRLSGRIGTMINVAGEKVSPGDVERVLASHPTVRDVHVFAAADQVHGQVPAAHVVLRSPIGVPELVHWCRERLAPHQIPRSIAVVTEISRSAMGKAQPIPADGEDR